MIRRAPDESDVAQAIIFSEMISKRISAVIAEIEDAEIDAINARRKKNAGAERRAHMGKDDLRGELKELQRQIRAIHRRFPSLLPG
jgi:hypothetical protein